MDAADSIRKTRDIRQKYEQLQQEAHSKETEERVAASKVYDKSGTSKGDSAHEDMQNLFSPWMQSKLSEVDENDSSSGEPRVQQHQHQPLPQHQILINTQQNGGSTSVKVGEDDAGNERVTLVRRRSIAALVSSTVVRHPYQQKITVRRSLGTIDGVQGCSGDETE